jgi:4-hydroxy-3-polyprenylbenzoate decarboxylase
MGPNDLKSFLDKLASSDDLARVKCQVDPMLEIAAIVNRVCKTAAGGKALLFENVKGSRIHIAANLFGSAQRMSDCFGVDDIEILTAKIRGDLAATEEGASGEILARLTELPECTAVHAAAAPWQELDVTAQGLEVIPALQSWPGDGGRYLTLGQVFTAHPETGNTNCGLYRVQLQDRHRALLRCHPGSGGAAHLEAWHDRGEAMPVAIALGGPPALTCAASISLPGHVSEVNFIGYLMNSAVAMSPGRTSQLLVPAAAEIVVEGRIFPGETMPEGPFGNHTGYYAPRAPAPVLRVESISMQQEAIYPCTVVGPPPMENIHLARTAVRLLLPLLQHDCPWVSDVYMPTETIFHRVALVSVAGDCELELEAIQAALMSSMLLQGAKLIILIDENAGRLGQQETYWRIINRLDDARRTEGVVVDARGKPGAKQVMQTDVILKTIESRWDEYGL